MNPALVEHVLSPVFEGLRGRSTHAILRGLRTSERWPPERHEALAVRKLARQLHRALRREAYAARAGLPAEWAPAVPSDVERLPLLDREFLRANREALADRTVPGGVIRSATGGSTGRPLVFYVDRRRLAFDRAARARANGWWGIAAGDREAYVWGSPRELDAHGRLRAIRDRLTNQLLLPAFELSERRVLSWFERLARFRPVAVFGYPSTLAVFCRLLRLRGRSLTGIGARAVVCAGEVLRTEEREAIGSCFGAPVVNQYGSRDGGFIAQECERGRLHVTAESTIVEIVADGVPAASGVQGEIVVTQLENRAMPFLRYRTGDLGRMSPDPCPCGRTLPVLEEVVGRKTDFLVTPDGRWLHGLALSRVVREVPGVADHRIEQEDVDAVRVRIVTSPGFPAEGAECIREEISLRMGAGVRVDVEVVAEIPADASGKHRPVRSVVGRDREARLASRA